MTAAKASRSPKNRTALASCKPNRALPPGRKRSRGCWRQPETGKANMSTAFQFEKELTALINRYSQENGSYTPDYILASYLCECLSVWNKHVTWYGRERISSKTPTPPEGYRLLEPDELIEDGDRWFSRESGSWNATGPSPSTCPPGMLGEVQGLESTRTATDPSFLQGLQVVFGGLRVMPKPESPREPGLRRDGLSGSLSVPKRRKTLRPRRQVVRAEGG